MPPNVAMAINVKGLHIGAYMAIVNYEPSSCMSKLVAFWMVTSSLPACRVQGAVERVVGPP